MGALYTVLVVVQVLSALGMVLFIMMQQGKGADMGASFGSGASGSVFGSAGSANFLSRTTAILATVFFVTTLMQAVLSGSVKASGSVFDDATKTSITAPAESQSPAIAPATKSAAENTAPANAVMPVSPAVAPAVKP